MGMKWLKKKIFALFWAFVLLFSFQMSAYASLSVSAQSAVLMCANSKEVLFAKDENKHLSMASTTKMMTSLIAIEAAVPNMEIVVTNEMVSVEGTSMGLVAGDSVSMNELIYGMLLQSGNDAANTVACVLGSGQDGFAKMMNERAAQIGMKNTNFVTASGLDSEKHYSTAYDMALLACECISNPEFVYICSQKSARLTYGNPPYARTLTNHNRLLWSYDDAIGIKTGFTKKSGRCLVSAAQRDGITLVAVTLNAPDDWNDHISMFEYGFSVCGGTRFKCDVSNVSVKVAGGKQSEVYLDLCENIICPSKDNCTVRILTKPLVYAPVKRGDELGKAVFYCGETKIAEVSLTAKNDVEIKKSETKIRTEEKKTFSELIEKVKAFFKSRR